MQEIPSILIMRIKVQSAIKQVWIDVLRSTTWDNPSIKGHWCIPKYVDGERNCHWWLQVSRNSMDSRSLFHNKWSEVDGMESVRRRELRNTPSTNMRYIATLDNLKEVAWTMNQWVYQEWPTCKDKITKEWSTQAKTSFKQEHNANGDWKAA